MRRQAPSNKRTRNAQTSVEACRMNAATRETVRKAFVEHTAPLDQRMDGDEKWSEKRTGDEKETLYREEIERLTWEKFTTDDLYLSRLRQIKRFLDQSTPSNRLDGELSSTGSSKSGVSGASHTRMTPEQLVNQKWNTIWLNNRKAQMESKKESNSTAIKDLNVPPPLESIIGVGMEKSHLSVRCGKCKSEKLLVLQLQASDGESASHLELLCEEIGCGWKHKAKG
jgi:hypothetical protein